MEKKSKVYFANLRASQSENLPSKLARLVKTAGIETLDFKDKFVAVKIHFGEKGNVAYIRPNYAKVVVDIIKELGGKPYLTDANTLYSGSRSNAIDHLRTAIENGFNALQVGCDVIIADGLRGNDERIVDIGGTYCPEPKIGAAIAEADMIVSLTHFKGHEMAGFGGAIKNLGMGSGSVAGKGDMHSTAQPKVNAEKCIGCGICEGNCAHDAIHVNGAVAEIDYEKCVGCGQCIAICENEGVEMGSTESGEILNYKIAEYTKAALKGKQHFHVAFIMNVSPECDCWGHNDAAIVPDIGMAASLDPVALDMACADLVNAAPLLHGNMITDKMEATRQQDNETTRKQGEECCCHHHHSEDKFHILHPNTNWQVGLRYAEELGIGTRQYELIKI